MRRDRHRRNVSLIQALKERWAIVMSYGITGAQNGSEGVYLDPVEESYEAALDWLEGRDR